MPTLAELYPAYGIRAPSIGFGSLGALSGGNTFAGLPMGALASLLSQHQGGGSQAPVLASYGGSPSSSGSLPPPPPSSGTPTLGPASIRFNNPGAMYPGPSSRRFGGTTSHTIGGGHLIAGFPDAVSGAAAHFDLLNRGYVNMTLADAIRRWSGGNSNDAYVNALTRATGLTPQSVLTTDLLRDPTRAIPLARAMARWEAGRSYPLTDAQWLKAHTLAFQGY